MDQMSLRKLEPGGKRSDARRIERERGVIRRFAEVYCQHHHNPDGVLCDQCSELLEYANQRLDKCPYDPKPKCKKCPTHCYKPVMRSRMKEVMKYSGMYFVRHGRLDWLVKYFLS